MPKGGRSTESDIATVILEIARDQTNGVASFRRIRAELPDRYDLTAGDLAPSTTRHGERMWEQQMRNIKSHDKEDDNFIFKGLLIHVPRVGYKITDLGRRFLAS